MGALNTKAPVVHQTSAGGVAYKKEGGETLVAIVSVGEYNRWQLPKGLIEKGEEPSTAAIRETCEEAGIEGELEAALDKIDYWYVGEHEGKQVRFHKIVHFFLLKFRSGDVSKHDSEVNEARWVPIREAVQMLTFKSERNVMEKAAAVLASTA
ncbi:MAG: NUDIX domain-containing protein [Gemmatimonadaceae bacterium]|nr:NUDIX domain-containing protein [Gemmatimonadaceae bacterium]